MSRFRRAILVPSLCLIVAGCYASGADVSLSPSLEPASLHAVAVRPFGDHGQLPAAGVTVARAFEAAFLDRGVRIVPYDRVREALERESGVDQTSASGEESWSARAWKRVHEETGVDAVFTGTITSSEEVPGGFPPFIIDCAFRLVDAGRGEVLASGNASEDGASPHTAASHMARRVLTRLLGAAAPERTPSP